MIHHLFTVKGGQGCTVTTALLALSSPGTNLIVDAGRERDMPHVLGCRVPVDWDSTCGVTADVVDDRRVQLVAAHDQLQLHLWGVDHIWIDHGDTMPARDFATYWTSHRFWLVTRRDYLALRRWPRSGHATPNGVIDIREPSRSLTADDVEQAVGAPVVATIDHDPTILRAVDAGLLTARRPHVGSLHHFHNDQEVIANG